MTRTARTLLSAGLLLFLSVGTPARIYAAERPDSAQVSAAAATMLGAYLDQAYSNLLNTGISLDRELFIKDIITVFTGGDLGYTVQEANDVLLQAMAPPQTLRADTLNTTDENNFVAAQAKRPHTRTLNGGTVLETLKEGNGPFPEANDTVMVSYVGRLSNGTIFDETTESPIALPMNNLIPGFTEALMQMKSGGSYRIFIPPMQAYKQEGVMDIIPGNAALDFTLDLIEIKKPK